MNFLEKLKLDKWYSLVLYIGLGAIVSSMYFQVDFIEPRHLFGLGLGLSLISFSFLIAEKKLSALKPPNAYTGEAALISWNEIHHNPITILILILGILLTCFFGILLIKELI